MVLSAEFRNIPEGFRGNMSFLGMVILGVVNSADIVNKSAFFEIPFMGSLNNDVTAMGGSYIFPTSAQPTFVVSSSANDVSGGTGLRKVRIEGLNDNYEMVVQEEPLNGLTDVPLPTDLLRVNKVQGTEVGSAEANIGDIDVFHAGNVLARIPALKGEEANTVFTVPVDFNGAILIVCGVQSAPSKKAKEGHVLFNLFTRVPGQSWRSVTPMLSSVEGTSAPPPYDIVPSTLAPKTDIRWNAVSTMDETALLAYYSILLLK
jgi:hypothetical protein